MNIAVRATPQMAATAFTARQLDTIRRTVAADTNNDEFNLFIEYARVKGLDPFSKQVVAIVFSKNDEKKRKMSIVTPQDGLRVLASRCGDYRPAEEEPVIEYDASLKGKTNPLGIIKCTTTLWKQDRQAEWHKVVGVAYWDEFAPIRTDDDAYEWVGTGEFWLDKSGAPTNKEKKRKRIKSGVDAAEFQTLEDGNWKKMPRIMIAKCATCQALRAGWPETFSGVYGEEEMDKARALDLTATEIVDQEREEQRLKIIAAAADEYPFVDDKGTLLFIPAGNFGDHIIRLAKTYTLVSDLRAMQVRNREGWNRFWAKHKNDALAIKGELEKIEADLEKAPATAEA